MLKLAIIDDEDDARSTLRSFLQTYCPDIEIIGEANDVASGVSLIRLKQADIVLLDIHLGAEIGFDILDKFTNPTFRVIFITAHDQYALKAFKYFALDYLLKPINPDLLIRAIDKAKTDIEKDQFFQERFSHFRDSYSNNTFDKIALPSAEGLSIVALEDILFLQSDVNYTLFFTLKNGKILVSKSLKNFEGILPNDKFYRVHQSYIVNIHFVKKVLKEDGGCVLLENGKKIPISRRRKDAFLNALT